MSSRTASPLIVACAMCMLGGIAANPAAASPITNLVVNGNFANSSGAGWTAFQTANSGISDNVEINKSTVYGLPCNDSSCNNLEVNGNAIDTVQQVVSGLTVGNTYLLSWYYAGRAGGATPTLLNVSLGGNLVAIDSYNGYSAPSWALNSYDIVATATSEILSFASQYAGGSVSYGNEITDVSLTLASTPAAVPEPSSFGLLGLGLTGLFMLRRRQAVA